MISLFRIISRDTLEQINMIEVDEYGNHTAWYMFDNTGIYYVERNTDTDACFFTDVTDEVFLEMKQDKNWVRIKY